MANMSRLLDICSALGGSVLGGSARALLVTASCVAACLGATGCSAKADIPEVVVTESDIAFDGVPLVPGFTDQDATLETQFDHPDGVDLPTSLNPKLYALSAKVTARGDMQDLSFLKTIKLQIASHTNTPPPAVVASYQRGSSNTASKEINLDIDSGADVLDYWNTKNAYYIVTISGSLPQDDWAIDATVSFAGQLSISTN